jgi:squalene-hopene/tetraprenyl-beta-curcumene cyclase
MSDTAVGRASAYLLAQAERQFAEVRHEITFTHRAGFTGQSERQSGDLFARATLANLCLDIAALSQDPETATALRAVARREATYLANAKVADRRGGWSYFPGLPELPPDADSLAAVLSLFLRIAPEYVPLCDEPVEHALARAGEDGSLETWIVAATDSPQQRERMQWAIRNCWGTGTDPDVLAHFYHALFRRAHERDRASIERGVSKLIAMQQPDGTWRSTWYVGPAFGTGLALRLLRETGKGEEVCARARTFLLDAQRADGAWGDHTPTALETALSMIALAETGSNGDSRRLTLGGSALQTMQLEDGSWPASPWIRMEIGRATGKIVRVLTYQSITITTAYCLKGLLLASRSAPLREHAATV